MKPQSHEDFFLSGKIANKLFKRCLSVTYFVPSNKQPQFFPFQRKLCFHLFHLFLCYSFNPKTPRTCKRSKQWQLLPRGSFRIILIYSTNFGSWRKKQNTLCCKFSSPAKFHREKVYFSPLANDLQQKVDFLCEDESEKKRKGQQAIHLLMSTFHLPGRGSLPQEFFGGSGNINFVMFYSRHTQFRRRLPWRSVEWPVHCQEYTSIRKIPIIKIHFPRAHGFIHLATRFRLNSQQIIQRSNFSTAVNMYGIN